MTQQQSAYVVIPEEIKGRVEEAALVAACLRRPAIFAEMRELVQPEHLDYIPYREAWQAMCDLAEAETGIDLITVGDELDRKGCLANWIMHDDQVFSGRMALSALTDRGIPAHGRDYAEIVRDYSNKRAIRDIMAQGAMWAQNGRKSADILADLDKKLSSIQSIGKASKHTVTLKEALKAAFDDTNSAAQGDSPYLPTGYTDLDKIITGFSAPDLTLICGRPGGGKTALLASICDNIMRKHKRIAFFTLEMDNKQIAMRLISMQSGIPFAKQRTGTLNDDEWTKYYAAINDLGDTGYHLYLNDLPAISPNRIRQVLHQIGPVDLVMLDYLQLAGSDTKSDNRVLELGYVSRGMKAIAKEFEVPVVAAAQLSRAIEQRADKEPQLSDIRESGSLEQDADNIIFIHRGSMESTTARITVAKQRNGAIGMCSLTYIGTRTRFETQTKIGMF